MNGDWHRNQFLYKSLSKMLSPIFQVEKKSLKYLDTIHFSKLCDVQKSQTKALFTYFTKYIFLQSNISFSCLLVTAQRRLPEYLRPFAANCFTMYIHEKCYGLGTSSIWNVTWKKCHQSWHWSVVGKKNQDVHGLAVFASVQFVISKHKGGQPEQT